VQGSGIYINPGVSSNPLVYNSITEKKFTEISFKMLDLHKRRPDKEEQQVFDLNTDDFIWAFTRLRRINLRNVQIEYSRMPAEVFADLNQKTIEHSIQQYVLSKGYAISHSLTRYQAVTINKEQAQILGCKKGIAAMHITNRGILQGGKVYAFSDIVDIDYSCTYVIPFNQDNLAFRQT